MDYAKRLELRSSTDNRQGSLALELRPTPGLATPLTGNLVRRLGLGRSTETGIRIGRFPLTINTVTPALTYQMNRLTHVRLQ